MSVSSSCCCVYHDGFSIMMKSCRNLCVWFPLTPLLPPCVDVHQVLGTPSEDTWPGVNTLPHFKPGETLFSSSFFHSSHLNTGALTMNYTCNDCVACLNLSLSWTTYLRGIDSVGSAVQTCGRPPQN